MLQDFSEIYNFLNTHSGLTAIILIPILIVISILIVYLIGSMKVYGKAGQRRWAVLIPVYNMFVLLKIIRKPTWWIIFIILAIVPPLMSIPDTHPLTILITIIALTVWFIMSYHLAKVFGRGIWFAIGLIILPWIFYPILGFGKSQYQPLQSSTV